MLDPQKSGAQVEHHVLPVFLRHDAVAKFRVLDIVEALGLPDHVQKARVRLDRDDLFHPVDLGHDAGDQADPAAQFEDTIRPANELRRRFAFAGLVVAQTHLTLDPRCDDLADQRNARAEQLQFLVVTERPWCLPQDFACSLCPPVFFPVAWPPFCNAMKIWATNLPPNLACGVTRPLTTCGKRHGAA